MSRIENEPALPACLDRNSLVFAPTAGMRLAPEVLVFEMFRELGYGDARNPGETKAQEFSDVINTPSVSEEESLLLSSCRGTEEEDEDTEKRFLLRPAIPWAFSPCLAPKTDRQDHARLLFSVVLWPTKKRSGISTRSS